MDERGMLDLVGRIYAAVTDASLWPGVLETVSDSFGGASILLGKQSFDSGAQSLMTCRMAPGPVERFASDFSKPERIDFIRHLPEVALAQPITPEMFQGEDGFLSSPLYHHVFRPFGLRYLVNSVLYREPGWACFLALVRPERAGPYTPDELERIGWLSEHLARAMALRNALAEADSAAGILSEVADRFDRGAAVVDGAGHVRFANRTAAAIFERSDGILLSGGSVRTFRFAETAELLRLIAQAAATSAGGGTDPGGVARITRRNGSRDYAVIVSPLVAAANAQGEPLALLLITDPDRHAPALAHIAGLHGLTQAEARLAGRLVEGDTPAEAARALDVSITTIRFHLRNLLAKTGTRRQAELIALLSEIHGD